MLSSSIVVAIMPKVSTSDRTIQRNRLAEEIKLHGCIVPFACQHCFLNVSPCVAMSSRPRCAACTQRGRECVGLSWESLDRTRAKLSSELVAAEEEQTRLFAKIIRLRKVLNQSQDHAERKASCLAEELADDKDGTEDKNPQTLSQLVDSMSPSFWDSIASPPQNVEASSRSS